MPSESAYSSILNDTRWRHESRKSIDHHGRDFILRSGTNREDDNQFSTFVERFLDPVNEIERKTEIEISGIFDHAKLEIRIGMPRNLFSW